MESFFPNVGLNRTFLKNIKFNVLNDTVDNSEIIESNINSELVEKLIMNNLTNITKYKNNGGIIVFNESLYEQKNEIINFSNLIDLLSGDISSYENFLGKDKGVWVDNFIYDDNEVIFESRFECGNLRLAIQINENEYDLLLKNDINSGKSSNWFFFRVLVKKYYKQKKIKFNIINCKKKDTLFSKGLRVLVYDEKNKRWSRNTKEVFYYINGLSIDDNKFYTLTFSLDINYIEEDQIFFFSYCYPYTYTFLMNYIKDLENDTKLYNFLRTENICNSLSENPVKMLLITNFNSTFDDIALRPAIILTGRVHPGESNSSYSIHGVINFLLDLSNSIADHLRKEFIFKIIPMLNPDGVINGNYRTCIIGKDLNRLWNDPRDNYTPTIYYAKEIIKKTLLSREIYLYCDFHGHSNKPNFFLYGCPSRKNAKIQYTELVLSKLLQNRNDSYSPESCIFKIYHDKIKTARAVIRNELGVDYSYCLESSIGMISLGENKNKFYKPEDYLNIGKDFCISIREMCKKEIFSEIVTKVNIDKAINLISMTNELNNYNVEGNKEELINKLGKITIKVKKKIKPLVSIEKKKFYKKS